MAKALSFLVVAAALTVSTTSGGAIPSKNDFIYLGSLKHSSNSNGKAGGGSIQLSEYYASVHETSWPVAQDDCVREFHRNATLLYIETEEEFANVTKWIADNNIGGSQYWIGGEYNVTSDEYQWHNGVPFGPWMSPWFQPGFGTGQTRVEILLQPPPARFATKAATLDNRFICEVIIGEPSEIPDPCYKDNDLVIAVDSSGSIGEDNYEIALEFTSRLAVAWAAHGGNRLSVKVYSDDVTTSIRLPESLSVAQIRDKVYSIDYQAGNTYSNKALDAAVAEFASSPRSVPKNLVFLTDGASTDPAATLAAATRVQAAGIRSFAVGITDSVNEAELLAIAGANKDHVFRTDGFDNLLKLLQPVSRRVCP